MKMRFIIRLFLLLLAVASLGGWLMWRTGLRQASTPATIPENAVSRPGKTSVPPQPRVVSGSGDVMLVQTSMEGVATGPAEGLVAIPEDEEPQAVLARAIGQMSTSELTSRLGELPLDELRGETGRLLIRRWAELDVAAAAEWARQLADAQACNELSTAVALVWSERDLPGALNWGLSLAEGETKDRVLTEMGYELARTYPAESMRLAVALPASDARDGVLLHALRQWAAADPETSQQWVLQLSPGPLREQALAAVATVMASQDGERAARFAVAELPPGEAQDRAIIGIVQRWAQVNYDQTAAWVELFPQSPLRHTALSVLHDMAAAARTDSPP